MKLDSSVLTGGRGFLVAEGVVVRVSTDTIIEQSAWGRQMEVDETYEKES